MAEGQDGGKALIVGGVAGGIAALVNKLLTPTPTLAAGERWDELLESQAAIIVLLNQLIAISGGEPGVDVIIQTQWKAKEPVQIYDSAIRSVGTFETENMVNWTVGKRFLLKVESSLDQIAQIQLVGNITDNFTQGVNIGILTPCPAGGGNISISPAWDDWYPFIGARITTAIAPTAGIIKVWVVIQE